MQEANPFFFFDPGTLEDGDLRFVLIKTKAGEPGSSYLPTYFFKMMRRGDDAEIGNIKLRVCSSPHLVRYGGNIGYGVEPACRGHHYAARACTLLFPLARQHNLRELWITCSPDNMASRKTCERLGAELVDIVNLPEDSEMYQSGEREMCRYRVTLLCQFSISKPASS